MIFREKRIVVQFISGLITLFLFISCVARPEPVAEIDTPTPTATHPAVQQETDSPTPAATFTAMPQELNTPTPTNTYTATPQETDIPTPTVTKTAIPNITDCIPPYPQPLFYDCFDGEREEIAKFQTIDGKLYGYFENPGSYNNGGTYPIPEFVGQRVTYIEFAVAIISGTDNGQMTLRTSCTIGTTLFVEFRGDGSWRVKYDVGNGENELSVGRVPLQTEKIVKISQVENGTQIVVNEESIEVPCDKMGASTILFLGAATGKIEGYIDNFGTWSNPPSE